MQDPSPQTFLNPLPGVVWLLLIPLIGIEAVLLLGENGLLAGISATAAGWRLEVLARAGFAAELQHWMWETGRSPARVLLRYLSYPFIHAGPLHAGFVAVLLAALGKSVAGGMRPWPMLALIVVSVLAGALAFGAFAAREAWLLGAYPAIFGLIGAFTWQGWAVARDRAAQIRAFGLIATLLLARLGFGLMIESGGLWIADLAGFAAGFAVTPILMPGGAARALATLRRR
ncbi:rhomboid family intramembrane serine protease [Roseicitreum antarcticum]|uniref:Rhomboid family protein n=1 Tax=Roseicitreum antarcticum TaxID=564137 RepID=A0A1H2SGU0_9RHOB|nr:rhomboid family intramembrane serine protease [Roseicitreum antarcticum]SDW30866.1 Rhomboid family protein [Roseicitreum antarcticum]